MNQLQAAGQEQQTLVGFTRNAAFLSLSFLWADEEVPYFSFPAAGPISHSGGMHVASQFSYSG